MDPAHLATLLISCADRKGIVAALAQTLYGHGANILDADQHTDVQAGQFFQRIRFDVSDILTHRAAIESAIAEVAQRLGMKYRLGYSNQVKNVAIFVSKYDHCLHDLLWRHRTGELACAIRVVVSNHPDLEAVAEQFGVPFHVFRMTPEHKAQSEGEQLALLRSCGIDLVVLARYMQIVPEELTSAFSGRIINIHHSFLPAFVGQRPYHQAHARGVKLIGATAHYATPVLDDGPIIDQDVARISHRESVEDLIRKGRDLEKLVLARAVRLHLEDRILVSGHKTVVFE
jgi:formyltetrahydrofolate deformylase